MEDSDETDTIHFNWISNETDDVIEPPDQTSINGQSTSGDVSHDLKKESKTSNDRHYTSEEKRVAWSKRCYDSGILTSFDSSHFSSSNNISSVDALLDERQVNAEEVLMNLGFGPADGNLRLEHRIPLRFLKSDKCSKRAQIERFINAHSAEFPETIARRKLFRFHKQCSMDECDNKSLDSSCNAGAASGSLHHHRASHDSFFGHEGSRGMITEYSVVRLMQCNLPPRYFQSLTRHINPKGMK